MPGGWSSARKYLTAFAVTAAAYCVMALIGLHWSVAPGAGSAVWPAAGVAFAALVIGGVRLWPAVAAGRLLAAVIAASPQPFWADLLVALATTAGAAMPAHLVERRGGLNRRLGRMRDMLWLIGGGALGGATISATLGIPVLLAGGMSVGRAPALWLNWWSGYFVGALTVAPLILAWWQRSSWRMPLRAWVHLDVILLVTAFASFFVFFRPAGEFLPSWYVYPPLVWAALAFQVRGAAVAMAVTSVFAITGAVEGTGVLTTFASDPLGRLLFAQQFMAVTALTILFLAAVADERVATSRLRESERRFRLMADNSPALIWVTDADGRTLFANRQYSEMLGLDPDELDGERWRRVIHPEDADSFVADYLHAVRTRTRFIRDMRVIDRNGELRWLHCDGVPRFTSGKFAGFTGVNIDVTTAKLAEQALRDNEAAMHLALQAGQMATWRWDMRAGQIVAGGSSSDIFGYAPGEIVPADKVTGRVHVEDRSRVEEAVRQGAAVRNDFYMEYRFARPDGEFEWLATHVRPVFGGDGSLTHLIGVSQVITDHKRAEQHRVLLINELNHRVKNTLAVVQGIAQQSFKDKRVPPELRRAFEGRLMALAAAHNVLTQENWEAAPLRRIVEDAVRPFGADRFRIAGPDLRIAPKAAVSLALALHELATNAAKYGALSCESGRIELGWSIHNDAPLQFALLWAEYDGPPVTPPNHKGFGSRLIERGLAAELDGEAHIEYVPEGVRCTISAPLKRLQG